MAAETGLAALLCLIFLTSQVFWTTTARGSMEHRIDAIFVKLTILAFLIYIIRYKRIIYNEGRILITKSSILIFILLGFLVFFAVASEVCSSNEWCGEAHIFYHSGLHIVGIMLAFYGFAPDGKQKESPESII